MRDLDRLDRDLVPLGVQGRTFPLGNPAVEEIPADDLGPVVVEQDDRAVPAIDVALDDGLSPVPQLGVLGDPAAEDDVRVLGQPGQLAHGVGLAADPVFDHDRLALQAADLAEHRARDSVDLDEEVEGLIGIVTLRGRHNSPASTNRPRILQLVHHRPPSERANRPGRREPGRRGGRVDRRLDRGSSPARRRLGGGRLRALRSGTPGTRRRDRAPPGDHPVPGRASRGGAGRPRRLGELGALRRRRRQDRASGTVPIPLHLVRRPLSPTARVLRPRPIPPGRGVHRSPTTRAATRGWSSPRDGSCPPIWSSSPTGSTRSAAVCSLPRRSPATRATWPGAARSTTTGSSRGPLGEARRCDHVPRAARRSLHHLSHSGDRGPRRLLNWLWYRNVRPGAELEDLLTGDDETRFTTSVPRGLVRHDR